MTSDTFAAFLCNLRPFFFFCCSRSVKCPRAGRMSPRGPGGREEVGGCEWASGGKEGQGRGGLHHDAWHCCASVWEPVCRWTALHLSYVNACVFISSSPSSSPSSPLQPSSPPLFLNLFHPSQPLAASRNHLLPFDFCFFATTLPTQNNPPKPPSPHFLCPLSPPLPPAHPSGLLPLSLSLSWTL